MASEFTQDDVNRLLHDDPDEARERRLDEIMPRDAEEAHAVVFRCLNRFPAVRVAMTEMSHQKQRAAESAASMVRLVQDLDRCEHGRHAKDSCFMCPGGKSTGNLLLSPHQKIGHTVHGRPIVVPAPGFDWLQRDSWMGEWPE